MFEAYHHAGDIERYGEQERMWSEFGSKRYAFISACEICAVLCGIEEMMKKIEEIEKEEIENLAFESMKIAIDILRTYEKSEQYTAEENCQGIMDTVKRYYAGEVEEECEYKALVRWLKVADAPAVLVKGIAEIFGKKFWELWDEIVIENPLRYMVELLEEAEENFYRVFAVSDYFEECMENLNDRRYQTLWRLYDKLIHNLELRKAADVILVPEEPGHEKEGVHYLGEEPKRRLIHSWDIMSRDKKYNKGRMTVRRYMALMANLPLRQKVFGF